jgi:hypothetical protein
MVQQMENSIKFGRTLIDSELELGLLNWLVKPIVKAFYDYWGSRDVRSGTLKQIELTLNSGKELLMIGNSQENFDNILNKSLQSYLKADQTTRQCNKDHKNYERITQVAKETFTNYLSEVVVLLNVKEEVNDYGDLCRSAFNPKKVAERNLLNQLNFTDRGIQIVEEDPSILKVPVGRKIILKALRRGFELTKKELIKALNDTYNEKLKY